MKIMGLDLAKTVFQIHGMDESGNRVVAKALKRGQVLPFFANLPPCLVGMEACGSAHHWARKLSALGHTVKLMAPQFVRLYVKSKRPKIVRTPIPESGDWSTAPQEHRRRGMGEPQRAHRLGAAGPQADLPVGLWGGVRVNGRAGTTD